MLALIGEIKLKKKKSQLEHQRHIAAYKAMIFDMLIDGKEKEYNIDIRKNALQVQSNPFANKFYLWCNSS